MTSTTASRLPDPQGTDDPPGVPRARFSREGSLAVLGTFLTWCLVLPRLVPGTVGDHGTYASVAERILAGDRLYVDVSANKDPLFYNLLALGRLLSPLADVALEVLWVLAAGLAVLVLARSVSVRQTVAAVIAFAGVPLVLTGAAYEPGMTHLPGVALTLVSLALAARSRWYLAGGIVVAVFFAKLILVPVAVVALVGVAAHRRAWADLLRAAAAAVVGTLAGVGALWARGELQGWIDSFGYNARYARGELTESRYGGGIGSPHTQSVCATWSWCARDFISTRSTRSRT